MVHEFRGAWITDERFAEREPEYVFGRQLEKKGFVETALAREMHANAHVLFRRAFHLEAKPRRAELFITADDYFKLYINGAFVTQGPAPAYPDKYGYMTVDVAPYLCAGRNVLAVHTYYQGLINRVWVSGDGRHGLLCDLFCDDACVLGSDEGFLTHPHTGYRGMGFAGYHTQFLEDYDSAAREVGFASPDFDDSYWVPATRRRVADWQTVPQKTAALTFERIPPLLREERTAEDGRRSVYLDFGGCYVGYLSARAKGKGGETVTVRCAEELWDEEKKALRYRMRCNCDYEETWRLSGGEDELSQFDFKAFRYAELLLPDGCELGEVFLLARHYPFRLSAHLSPHLAGTELERVWELSVRSLRYGVQEVIQDCMEREKGFYVGDGCYTALAQMLLSGDDAIVRKLIDDGFHSAFITDGLVTCLDCSFMQEIAEYPLMLCSLVWWHYLYTKDEAYLRKNYGHVTALLDVYRRDYEREGLLRDLDKWCVVEWPENFRDGYDVDIREWQICRTPHVAINAYYLHAIDEANKMARALSLPAYRDVAPLKEGFYRAFYDGERHLYRDSGETEHISYIGNVYPFAFGLFPEEAFVAKMHRLVAQKGLYSMAFFGTFPLLYRLFLSGEEAFAEELMASPHCWLRMLREGATTTFEAWGKDSKWNTSLFHLTYSFAAVFLSKEGRALMQEDAKWKKTE